MKIKGFDKNMQCRGYQFKIGGTYDTGAKDSELELYTNKVFHYCESIEKVHDFYSVNNDNRFCEIEVLGEEIKDNEKCGSNKIKVVREIIGDELDIICGKINGNTGLFNSGDRNSGDMNSGDMNSGNMNSGNRNSGDMNSGNRNSGDMNSGNMNSGDRNSGIFNKCNYSNGVFCNKEPKISIFNIQTDWTLKEFYNSRYWDAIYSSDFPITEYVNEKLVTYTYKESCFKWWEKLTDENKNIILQIPKFDKAVFLDITGIQL